MKKPALLEIRRRLRNCLIPKDAVADWKGTNHYEVHTARRKKSEEYWWLDGLDDTEWDIDLSDTLQGRRIGEVLDYACAYKRDVAALLAIIDGGAP